MNFEEICAVWEQGQVHGNGQRVPCSSCGERSGSGGGKGIGKHVTWPGACL